MIVIFLDIDGVLNGHQKHENGYCGIYPECVTRFNRLLDAVPDAMVVVSSAWRYLVHCDSMTVTGFENLLLTHGVKCQRRIFAVTRRDHETNDRRENQISEWVERYSPDKWVVLDDLYLDLPQLVQTNGEIGLTDSDINEALDVLGLAVDQKAETNE
jgi:hypothetical protein